MNSKLHGRLVRHGGAALGEELRSVTSSFVDRNAHLVDWVALKNGGHRDIYRRAGNRRDEIYATSQLDASLAGGGLEIAEGGRHFVIAPPNDVALYVEVVNRHIECDAGRKVSCLYYDLICARVRSLQETRGINVGGYLNAAHRNN